MDWSTFIRRNLESLQPYQAGLREDQVRYIAKVDNIYKLSSNESPLPPFPSSLEVMRDRLVTLNEYPDGTATDLLNALAEHYQVPSGQIVLGNGTNELLNILTQICIEPGDNVIYSWPSFIVYRLSAQVADIEFREAPITPRGSFDLEAMLNLIDERTKIVYICTPNNPTGGIVTKAEFDDFLKRVSSDVLIVLDAAYDEFVTDKAALDPLSYFDGVRPIVVFKTFSKIYALAGIRCGYGLAPEPVAEAINKVREPFNVNSVAQAGALAALKDRAELERRAALNAQCRNKLEECFASLNLNFIHSEANYVWVWVPDAQATFEALLKRGIVVRAIPGVNGLRVGVGDREGIEATTAAFKELFGA